MEELVAHGDSRTTCWLCFHVGEILNEVPADGGKAPWKRWTVGPGMAYRPSVDRMDAVFRCRDHAACLERVRANGDRWEVRAQSLGIVGPDPEPAAAAGDDDPLWGAS